MLRRIAAITMLVSFVAMATSGAMMFVIEKPSFTIQMHPVHKLFGMLMVLAALAHIPLNFRAIKAHVKSRSGVIAGSLLSVALVFLYSVAINNTLPEDVAQQMDEAAAQAEAQRHGEHGG